MLISRLAWPVCIETSSPKRLTNCNTTSSPPHTKQSCCQGSFGGRIWNYFSRSNAQSLSFERTGCVLSKTSILFPHLTVWSCSTTSTRMAPRLLSSFFSQKATDRPRIPPPTMTTSDCFGGRWLVSYGSSHCFPGRMHSIFFLNSDTFASQSAGHSSS